MFLENFLIQVKSAQFSIFLKIKFFLQHVQVAINGFQSKFLIQFENLGFNKGHFHAHISLKFIFLHY